MAEPPTPSETVSSAKVTTTGKYVGVTPGNVDDNVDRTDSDLSSDSSSVINRNLNLHRPCPCSMQSAMFFIGATEMFIYFIMITDYTRLYNTFRDPSNFVYYEAILVRAGRWTSDETMDTGATIQFIASLCLAHIVVAFVYITAAVLLVIGAARRNLFICAGWILVVGCLMIVRVILVFLMSIQYLTWGMIWLLFELYFLYAVTCFAREIQAYPEGYSYKAQGKGESEETMESTLAYAAPTTAVDKRKSSRFQFNRRTVHYEPLV